jgi:1-aminocyclopropane-1-carboxylate deaminase/D-cysteine desulfhydrase-like pyridoxal-dependent ACC family enzyme
VKPDERRPLFVRYPALRQTLPFTPYAELPTPVERLPAHPQAWIKRDDVTDPRYGGNKVRKLEFVLAEIRARGARHVYTFGATGTNAGLAMALMCRQERLDGTVFLFEQPDSPVVQRNYAIMQAAGARLIHCRTLMRAALAWYLHPGRLSRHNYFLFAGCSNPVATFAYVNAAFELAGQIQAGLCPEPEQIFVAAGSGSTQAGLTLGCALAGLKSQVIGVRVVPTRVAAVPACTASVITGQMRAALKQLIRSVPQLKGTPLPPVTLHDDWYGDAYGAPTAAALEAIEWFGSQGLSLEQTYTGKAAAAFLDALRTARGPLMFWNTYNSRPVSEASPLS